MNLLRWMNHSIFCCSCVIKIFYYVAHTTFAVSYLFRSITQRKWSYSNFGTVQRWTLSLFVEQLARRCHVLELYFSSVWLLPICSLFILHNHHISFIGSHYCSRLKLFKCNFYTVLTKFVRPDISVAAGVFYTFEQQRRLVIRRDRCLHLSRRQRKFGRTVPEGLN